MSDYVVRMLAKEAGVRGLGCLTTGLAREGARRHKTSPVATVALGQDRGRAHGCSVKNPATGSPQI